MFVDNNFFTKNVSKLDFKESTESVSNKSSMFSDMLNNISNQENSVSDMKNQYINGERDDIQNILIEGQKLNLQINFALQVRNNLVNAFQQLSTIQV